MSLVKCKCGKYTQNGLLCVGCQKDSSIDTLYYTPEESDDAEELDELGFTVIDDLEEYTDGAYEDED